MVPYALCFFNRISVAFFKCVNACISCTVQLVWVPDSHLFCSYGCQVAFPFWWSSGFYFTAFSCDGRTCLLGSSTFGVWTGDQEPLLAVEHKTSVVSSMKNNYSLGLRNSTPRQWHNQRQPTTFWKYGPSIACWDKQFYRCIEVYKNRQLEEFRINGTPGSTWLISWPYSLGPGESCFFLPWHLSYKSSPWTYSVLELDSKFLKRTPESGQYPSLAREAFSLSVGGTDIRMPWGGKSKATANCGRMTF